MAPRARRRRWIPPMAHESLLLLVGWAAAPRNAASISSCPSLTFPARTSTSRTISLFVPPAAGGLCKTSCTYDWSRAQPTSIRATYKQGQQRLARWATGPSSGEEGASGSAEKAGRRGKNETREEASRRLPSFEVVEVPTYEEMLEWARAKDRDIAVRKIYGLRGLLAEGSHEVALKPLGSREGAQLKGLVQLLQKRLAEQKAFLPNEMEKLRDGMSRLEQVVKDDAAYLVKAKELQQGRGRRRRIGGAGGGWAPDPIYGSKEVREVLYLFVWSLLRERGTHLLKGGQGQGEGQGEEGRGEGQGKEGGRKGKEETHAKVEQQHVKAEQQHVKSEQPRPTKRGRKKGGAAAQSS